MKFANSFLRDTVNGDGDAKVVQDTITGHSRWTVEHTCIFEWEGKLYMVHYDRGATEYQDYRPFENDGPEIDCTEVEAYEATITAYRIKV